MPITDKNIVWARKHRYYGPMELNGLITIAVAEGGSTSHGEGEILGAPVDKTVRQFELSTLGLVGIRFPAADDIFFGYIRLPYDIDPEHELGIRLHFTQSGAVSTGVLWIFLYGIENAGDVISAPATVLNTILVEKLAGGSAYESLWTDRGIILSSSHALTRDKIEGGSMLTMSIEDQAEGTSIANVTLLGVELDYTPIKMVGAGSNFGAPLSTQPVSV